MSLLLDYLILSVALVYNRPDSSLPRTDLLAPRCVYILLLCSWQKEYVRLKRKKRKEKKKMNERYEDIDVYSL